MNTTETTADLPAQYVNRPLQEGDSWIAELNPSAGDFKTVWNRENADEVSAAKKQFDDLTGKGFTAYRCDKNGDKGELIRTFDPNAEAIILVPRMKGG